MIIFYISKISIILKNKKILNNYFFKIINKFAKEDDTGLGGSISQDDIYTTIKVIIDHFQEINNFF